MEKQTGKAIPELHQQPPYGASLLWAQFINLRNATPAENPISFQEIRAWQELYGWQLTPWELDVIRELDSAYHEVRQQHFEMRNKANA